VFFYPIFLKKQNTSKVYVDGKNPEIKSFFEDLLFQWKNNAKID